MRPQLAPPATTPCPSDSRQWREPLKDTYTNGHHTARIEYRDHLLGGMCLGSLEAEHAVVLDCVSRTRRGSRQLPDLVLDRPVLGQFWRKSSRIGRPGSDCKVSTQCTLAYVKSAVRRLSSGGQDKPPRGRDRSRYDLAVWIGVVAACVSLVAFSGWWWSGGTRVELASWLEAAATVAAVAAATVAGAFAARAIRIEQERDDRWIAQQRSTQASRIAAWSPRLVLEDEGGVMVLTGAYVRLRNVSDVPVSRVTVETALVWPIASGGSGRTEFVALDVGLLPPYEPADGLTEHRVPIQRMPLPSGAAVDVQLSFVDAGGQAWTRLPDGQLIEG